MEALAFLSSPAFVVAWYAVGFVAAVWVAWDEAHANTPLKTAMKWAWPIIVLFFSLVGLALYFATARAPGVGRAGSADAKKALHGRYEKSMLRRVNGAVIHCVAGDGLGIVTAMVVARLVNMTFWQEFWFEYAVGFAFGLFVFQLKSMKMMTDSTPRALWMAFRAEMFSMFTVMGAMGAVMTYVTPMVVGAQPKPGTAAFWGFAALGLMAGFVATFPMNWMLVKVGWKHGMGPKEDAHPVSSASARGALFGVMVVLGLAALAVPAWLTEVRERSACPSAHVVATEELPPLATAAVVEGARAQIAHARDALRHGDRHEATEALDALRRLGRIDEAALPGAFSASLRRDVGRARTAFQQHDASAAVLALERAEEHLKDATGAVPHAPADVSDYEGAMLVDPEGRILGEVAKVDADHATVELGGTHDVWGVLELAHGTKVEVPRETLVFGPARAVGPTMVLLTTPVACATSFAANDGP